MSDNNSKYKRTNLFLLRMWCDNPDENESESEKEHTDKDERSGRIWQRQWHGVVQRTVSGEEHGFEGKDGLIEALEVMLYKERKERPKHSKRQEKTGSEANLLSTGNNQAESDEGTK